PRCARWGSRPGRINCCKRSCAPSWKHTTNRNLAPAPTVSDRDADATRPSRKSSIPGRARDGSSREISKDVFNIDHQVLLSILRDRIHDNRFLILVENLLKAGYLEEWDYRPTLSGTPQGGIVSPLLANIYMDRLDDFVGMTLIPRYTRGE